MNSRRTFLKKSAITAAAFSMPAVTGCVSLKTVGAKIAMKTTRTGKALILWFSQTGYTERHGKLLAVRLEKLGLKVTSGELRNFEVNENEGFDLIVIGSPVYYYDTPDYVKTWIRALPRLKGTPVAAYVTFGGPEGNQDNAVFSILEILAEKGGVPVGAQTFMNMSSFPLSWSEAHVSEKVWMSRHLPNQETYDSVCDYAEYLVNQINQGKKAEFSRQLTMRETLTWIGPIYWTKKFVKNHSIVKDDCIECGTCVEKCPVDAIDLSTFEVDTDVCVFCCGCINNCPAQAVYMEYSGKRVIGYKDFMKKKNLSITEPEELST